MLQADMDKLNKWSEDWLLKINVDKCKKMTVGKVPDGDYQIGNGVNRKTLETVLENWFMGMRCSSVEDNKQNSHGTRICCPHVASRQFIGSEPMFAGLVTSLTLSPTPNFKSIDIKF